MLQTGDKARGSATGFAFMMNRCDEREIEFALHMIEQILRGQEDYLSE